MKVPNSGRKSALFVIDLQPPNINQRTQYIIPNIEKLLKSIDYDLYFEALFYAEIGSIWHKQHNWTFPKDERFHTVPAIADLLRLRKAICVEKTTKSIFKGDQNVEQNLRKAQIEEIHLVGIDSYDCVLASAYEAFDLGFYTYVIEECCQSASSQERHENALAIFRYLNMTNHSFIENIELLEI